MILPVDQGFEHGPARSFAPNPAGYDPRYHVELAIESGCNAYAAPLGFIEAGATDFAGDIPLILKLNNHDVLHDEKDPRSSLTGSVRDAQRLGCVAIGFTIYPGSSRVQEMYEQIRELALEAKQTGLAVVVWSYPRGSSLSKEGETAIDVVADAADIAAELGAHVVKTYYCDKFEELIESCPIPVIVAGGKKTPEMEALELTHNSVKGGAVGVDMGRNIFQSDSPVGMIKAVRAIVHENVSVKEAYKIYESEKGARARKAG